MPKLDELDHRAFAKPGRRLSFFKARMRSILAAWYEEAPR